MGKNGTPFNEFFRRFLGQVTKKITPEQILLAEQFFKQIKSQVIQGILNTDVSKELISHSAPSKILNTKGSLFGFLGLVEGQQPVDEIINIVEKIMSYRISRRLIRGGVKITIKVPELRDFRTDDLVLQWDGGYSVVDAIEKGISGLGHYVKAKNLYYSRSGEGVQVEQKVRESEFRGVKWISPILKSVHEKAKQFR